MGRQPPAECRGDAHVEDVGQRRWIPARASEVCEQASHEPDASGRGQLHEELHARADARHDDRKGVVHVEGAEDEEAPASPAPDLVRNELARLEARDRTERRLLNVARGAGEKLGSRPLVSCQGAELHSRLHRSFPRCAVLRAELVARSLRVVGEVDGAFEEFELGVVQLGHGRPAVSGRLASRSGCRRCGAHSHGNEQRFDRCGASWWAAKVGFVRFLLREGARRCVEATLGSPAGSERF